MHNPISLKRAITIKLKFHIMTLFKVVNKQLLKLIHGIHGENSL